MSLEVALLPFDSKAGDTAHHSHTILPLNKNYDFFEVLEAYVNECGEIIPEDFTSHMANHPELGACSCYGRTQFNTYDGSSLKTVTAVKLYELYAALKLKVDFEFTAHDQGVFSFIRHLDPETRVAIMFH